MIFNESKLNFEFIYFYIDYIICSGMVWGMGRLVSINWPKTIKWDLELSWSNLTYDLWKSLQLCFSVTFCFSVVTKMLPCFLFSIFIHEIVKGKQKSFLFNDESLETLNKVKTWCPICSLQWKHPMITENVFWNWIYS